MVYLELYEEHEHNASLHRSTYDVEQIEIEVDAFVSSLDEELRSTADTLFGKMARAYEIQGFLFGGLVCGGKWDVIDRSPERDKYLAPDYRGSVPSPVYQIDCKTNKVIAEYESVSAAARANNLWDSAISKACKGKLATSGGYKWRYIEK